MITKLQLFDITIHEARQAKCTQRWFDEIIDPNELFEEYVLTKLPLLKKCMQ